MKYLPVFAGISTFLLLCASMVLYVIYPDPSIVNSSAAATLLMALLWIFLVRKSLWVFLWKKSTRSGANLSFVVLLIFGILFFLNILAKDYNWRKDITRSASNSLSAQSLKILHGLKDPVKIYYFGSLGDKDKNEPLLKNYARENKKISYEFVDMDRRPTLTQSMDVKRKETVVLAVGEKKHKIEGVTEEKVTNGFIKLLKSKEQFVYFTTGHGERALSDSAPLGYSALKEELQKQGYAVKEVNLLSEGKIPADAAALVVAGPAKAFFPRELEILGAWMKTGHVMVAADLSPADSGLTKGSKQIAELLQPFGLIINSEMLVDPTSRAANVEPQVLLGFNASREHPITKDFPTSVIAANFLFPLTTYLQAVPMDGFSATILANTSQNAWAESDWGSLRAGAVKYEAGKDKKGAMALAYAIEGQKAPKTRLVAFATSTFATNSLIDKVGNRDLFLNAIAWLADEEEFISIRPRAEEEGIRDVNNGILNLVLLISVFVVPFMIIAAGVFVWMRRAKL